MDVGNDCTFVLSSVVLYFCDIFRIGVDKVSV